MAQFLNDTFSGETTGTALTAHTANSGATWTAHPSWSANGTVKLNSYGSCYTEGASWGMCYASVVPSSADYAVIGDVYTYQKDGTCGIAARVQTGANTFYYVYTNMSAWRLGKMVADTDTILQSYAQTPVDGNHYIVKLECVGSALKVYVDGSLIISETDSSITDAGRAGVYLYEVNGLTVLDYITAEDAATATTSLIIPRAGRGSSFIAVR